MKYLPLLLSWVLCAGLVASDTAIAQSVESGFRILFEQRSGNCTACHSIPDRQGKKIGIQSTFAPPLDGVGSRLLKTEIVQWITDARALKPQTLMPPFGVDLNTNMAKGRLLTDAQIADVVAALETLR